MARQIVTATEIRVQTTGPERRWTKAQFEAGPSTVAAEIAAEWRVPADAVRVTIDGNGEFIDVTMSRAFEA